MDAKEKDALYGSGGGGRGRVAYLKMRRTQSVQHRFGQRPQTTSHMYGWDSENAIQRAKDSNLSSEQPPKKKPGVGSLSRPRGVFSTPEFIGPNL